MDSSYLYQLLICDNSFYASSPLSFTRNKYLFHSNTGTVSWEIPTPLNLFISLLATSRDASTLFSGQTKPLCIITPDQRCSDASRLVLQGGILGFTILHLHDYHLSARTSISPCSPLVQNQVTHDCVNLGYSISHERLVVGARLMNPIKICGRITPKG